MTGLSITTRSARWTNSSDAASSLDASATERLRQGLNDCGSGVRALAVLGHLMHVPRLLDHSPALRFFPPKP